MSKRQSLTAKPRELVTSDLSDQAPSGEISHSPKPLPQCFDSEFSDGEDFWGFPPEAVISEDVQSKYVIKFELNDGGKELFGEGDSSDTEKNFTGFSLEDM